MAPNVFLPCGVKEVLDRVLRATFTDPKVARVGLSKDQAKERLDAKAIVCRWDMDRVDRAATESDGPGFVKVVQRQDGSIPGATVVAAPAGEIIHELSLAMDLGMKVGGLANSIHV
jgi:dihydrolipoamide dehydrogenase